MSQNKQDKNEPLVNKKPTFEEIESNFERLDTRCGKIENLMRRFKLFALGLEVDLASFVVFEKPPVIHVASFVQLSNYIAKLGYKYIPCWNKVQEKRCRYFLLIGLAYLQFLEENKNRTFGSLCILAEEMSEDFEVFCGVMLSNIPNNYMAHYIEKIMIEFEDDEEGLSFLPSFIELLFIAFLEENSSKEAMGLISDTIFEDTSSYINENNYDIFGLTEEELNELLEEENNDNVEILDDELDEGSCKIYE